MANPLDAWMQVPTSVLDLGQRTADADAWAQQQRAKIAETWANTQRQAVSTMATTWQQGMDSVDHFADGFGSATPTPQSQMGPLGYNDMAGADTSPQGPLSALQGQPEGIQAAGTPRSTSLPEALSYGAGQASNEANNLRNTVVAQVNNVADQNQYAFNRTLGTRADQPARPQASPRTGKLLSGFTPEQLASQQEQGFNAVLGVTPGENVAGETTRFFHGTGSDFPRPTADKFDPNGLFGPGYYLTDDARVANSYAHTRAGGTDTEDMQNLQRGATTFRKLAEDSSLSPAQRAEYRSQADWFASEAEKYSGIGANVRAVSVPKGLNLLDAETWPGKEAEDRIIAAAYQQLGDHRGDVFSEALGPATGFDIWRSLGKAFGDSKEKASKFLQDLGYNGIQYAGGKRTPLNDATGAPIEHTAVVIFPNEQSLGKLTNAISGTKFGSPPAVGGALVGGYAGSQQGDTPEERARNAALGAVSGAVGGHLLGRLGAGENVDVGLSIKPEVPTGTLPKMASEALKDAGGTAAQQTQLRPREAGDAANIMLSKFEPSVRALLDTAATTMNDFAGQRRGVITDAQALANAAETARLGLGLSVQDFLKTKAGTAFNQEQAIALGQTLNKTGEDFDALATQVRAATAAGTVTDAQKAALASKALEFAALASVRSGVTAEAGRTLRAFRQALDGSGASREFAINTAFKAIGTDPQAFTNWLTAWQTTPVNDFTNRYKLLQSLYEPKFKDYQSEWLYNAILSNPSTHIANSVSNTVNALLGPVERLGAAAVDVPLSAFQGRPRGRFFGEAKANTYGLIQGIPEGVRAATFAMTHGFTEAAAIAAKGEIPRREVFRGPVGAAINLPSRMMTAADAFMQPILQRGALNAEIFRSAAASGLSGQALTQRIAALTANVPPELMERAGKMAEYQLYRQEPKTVAKHLTGLRGLNVAGVEPLRFVLPFVQVPVNATKYGLERTPLGFLNPDLWTNLAKKDPAAADNIARAGMGSMVAAGIGSLVATGNLDITGAAPTDPAKRDAFYRQGKLPFSLKVGDKWLSYQRWEPFNHSLTQVAAVVDAIRNGKAGASTSEQAMQAGLTIGQNIESQSFLTGINGFLNAVTDPERYGAQFMAQLETSMVPASSAMRATANAFDPRQRAPQGPVENIKSVIPGLSRNVPSRLNNYGEEQSQPGNPFLPYKFQQANDSQLETELYRLKVQPGSTGKTLRGIDLTRQENADYQRLSGGLVKASLTQLLQDPRYAQADDIKKAKALEYVITHAKDAAAQQYINQLVASQGKDALTQRIQQKKFSTLPRAG